MCGTEKALVSGTPKFFNRKTSYVYQSSGTSYWFTPFFSGPEFGFLPQVEEAMADAEAEALRKQRAADEKADRDAATRMVIDELKILYKQKLMPVEQTFL